MTISALGRVPADHVAVVERLGRVERAVPAGERVRRLPVMERVSCVLSTLTHRLALRDESVVGADQVVMLVEADVDYRIVDAMVASVAVTDYQDMVSKLAIHTLRRIATGLDSEAMLVSSGAIGESLRTTIAETLTQWGFEVTRTNVSFARYRQAPSPTCTTELLGYR